MLDHPTSVQKNVFAGTFCWVSRPISFSQFQSRKISLHLSKKVFLCLPFRWSLFETPVTSASLLRKKTVRRQAGCGSASPSLPKQLRTLFLSSWCGGPTLIVHLLNHLIGKWSYILLLSLSTVQLFLVLNKKQQPNGIKMFSFLFEGPTFSFLAQFSGSFHQKRENILPRFAAAVVFWSLPKLYKQE